MCGAALLALYILGRPLNLNKPIKQDNLLAINKLLAEGSLSEIKVLLSWSINTRVFEISLPDDKFSRWIAQINRILHHGKVSPKELESIIGWLNHAAYIIPLACHYLNPFPNLLKRNMIKKFITLTAETTIDFFLWK